MGKFVFAYTGGTAPQSEAEGAAVMEKWINWFGTLGPAVVDGGNPFGASTVVAADESISVRSSGLTGYSIVTADSLSAAAALAEGCPVLAAGGAVEVYEAHDM